MHASSDTLMQHRRMMPVSRGEKAMFAPASKRPQRERRRRVRSIEARRDRCPETAGVETGR